ncbi:hypothetical protein M8PIadj_0996 [Bifidobacterium animalis]|nr:hypothetical protein W91_1008 [Bifidobacterium animalis subsp. lactis Bi-07]AJD34093.1 hypothetical protein BAA6_0980 [Bifidobacterium animalis]QIR81012.1 hypothetical protein M8PIadj_0996 [Bifidobacterium animalis]
MRFSRDSVAGPMVSTIFALRMNAYLFFDGCAPWRAHSTLL